MSNSFVLVAQPGRQVVVETVVQQPETSSSAFDNRQTTLKSTVNVGNSVMYSVTAADKVISNLRLILLNNHLFQLVNI